MKKLLLGAVLVLIVALIFIRFSENKLNVHEDVPRDKGLAKGDLRGKIVESLESEKYTTEQITIYNKQRLPSSQLISPKYAVDRYLVKFISYDHLDKPIVITAQYYVPEVNAARDFPLYVFGSGTTGIGDACAPSKEVPEVANWSDYKSHMLAYASQGYIVIFPDYEGFNDLNRIHHYFNAELESNVLLDAARSFYAFAVDKKLTARPAKEIFLSGYSQGGHAALAAKDMAKTYAPELTISGVIAYAPASNVEALLREAPSLAPYLTYAYADIYGKDVIDPANVLLPKWLVNLEKDVQSVCIDRAYQFYNGGAAGIYQTSFYDALFSNRLGERYPKFKEVLDKNFAGMDKSTVPSILLQGAEDPIVTANTVKGVFGRLCNSGNKVIYKEYPNINHFRIRQVSYLDALAWMKAVQDGKVQSNCL
jgi:dienelactone hydrolase